MLLELDEPVRDPACDSGVLAVLPVRLPLVPARFCSVPFTSTFLPTSEESSLLLPLSLYVLPEPIVLPAPPAVELGGFPAVGLPAVDPVVPVDEPPDIEASVRM
jgi:hypothetical protein